MDLPVDDDDLLRSAPRPLVLLFEAATVAVVYAANSLIFVE